MLRAVRHWGPIDRVRECGLLDAWSDEVAAVGGQGSARIEIELWFRDDASRRTAAQAHVEEILGRSGGTVISTAVVGAIDYHAILADLPFDQVQAVLDSGPEAIELLTTESIMLIAPARPMSIPAVDVRPSPAPTTPHFAPSAAPRVALLDGLPLANHNSLSDRLVIDDPDDLARAYTTGQQYHGTAMSSLICHGDMSAPGEPLSTRLYVRPIMQPNELYAGEVTVRNQLLVDLLHRAFRRMFEGDGARGPTAPSVRIVNLSIGDPVRVFARSVSPLAKLLDWLAYRYNILILVSAGNQHYELTVPSDALDNPDALKHEVLASSYAHVRRRRILSPAESINALTVGAAHSDSATTELPDTVLEALDVGMPANYSAVGFGHRRSVKPEICLPGGRQLFQRPPPGKAGHVELLPARHEATGPGVLVAAPDPRGGSDGQAFSCGTSNATALGTRNANQIFDVIENLRAQQGDSPFPDSRYYPVLVKTLLVHAANWGENQVRIRSALGLDPRTARRDVTQLLGYGTVDETRVASATRTRAVLLGAGSIENKQRHTFSVPLPPALSATTEWRRLTITMGWLSPIIARSRIHRMARLLFRPHDEALALGRSQADHNAARRGTIQHEILEGSNAVAYAPSDSLEIDVDCRVDAGRLDTPVRFAVVASLETADTVRADIQAEVRQGVQVQLSQRQQVSAR